MAGTSLCAQLLCSRAMAVSLEGREDEFLGTLTADMRLYNTYESRTVCVCVCVRVCVCVYIHA